MFDLTSGRLEIEEVGAPGTRGWKAVVHRQRLDPFVIDSSMVDPQKFSEVLRAYRR